MQPILPNGPQNIEFQGPMPNPAPTHGHYATIFKVVTAVTGFFREIGLWFLEATSWLKNRAINLFPISEAAALFTPEMNVVDRFLIIWRVIIIPVAEREAAITNALRLATPQMDGYARRLIIRKIIAIPVAEREAVIANALRLVIPQMGAAERGFIIREVIAIPVEEREEVIINALKLVTPQMNVYDRIEILLNGLTIDVHAGNRDQQVRAAIELLRIHQGQLPEARIDQAVQEFSEYLDSHQMDAEDKRLAKRALSAPKEESESFGPLISEEPFTILGLEISGKELIGRLWIFASGLAEPDQTNAKDSMISALKDSYYMGSRVCDQGKTQRSVIGVLQGRLEGVDIELSADMQVPTPLAVAMFFHVEAHRNIEQLEPLLNAANRFCDDNPAVNRDDFVLKIRLYAQLEGFGDEI